MAQTKELLKKYNVESILPYVYFNEDIMHSSEAVVSISANSMQYGKTAFAGIRGYISGNKIKIFRLKDHYLRLMNASKILGFEYYIEYEEFKNIIAKLIKKNKPNKDIYIRPFLSNNYSILSPSYLENQKFDLSIYMIELAGYNAFPQKLKISSYIKYSDRAISTKAKAGGTYINSYLVSKEAKENGFDEGIVFDEYGFAIEANVANLIVSYRDKLLVPMLASGALEGITIRSALELLKEANFNVVETNIDRSTLYCANEVILLGTAVQVNFAYQIDSAFIGSYQAIKNPKIGKVGQFLKDEFNSIIAGSHKKSNVWVEEFEV